MEIGAICLINWPEDIKYLIQYQTTTYGIHQVLPGARGDRLLGLDSLDGVGEESAQTIHDGDQVLQDKSVQYCLL